MDKGQIDGVVFIYLKKAFDTVDHSILIKKLKLYGLNDQSLNFFTSYLENRSQRCFVNGHLSQKVSEMPRSTGLYTRATIVSDIYQ